MLNQQDLQSPVDLFHIQLCDATKFFHSFATIDGCIQMARLPIWDDHRAIERITQPHQVGILTPQGDEFLQHE